MDSSVDKNKQVKTNKGFAVERSLYDEYPFLFEAVPGVPILII